MYKISDFLNKETQENTNNKWLPARHWIPNRISLKSLYYLFTGKAEIVLWY